MRDGRGAPRGKLPGESLAPSQHARYAAAVLDHPPEFAGRELTGLPRGQRPREDMYALRCRADGQAAPGPALAARLVPDPRWLRAASPPRRRLITLSTMPRRTPRRADPRPIPPVQARGQATGDPPRRRPVPRGPTR